MKKLKKISKNQDEEAVAKYWLTHNAVNKLDWSKAEHWVFPNLKLSSQPITIRLPKALIIDFKLRANKMDVPYQSLMKQALFKGLALV
jgi:predicted DNA binding CopG/RHH family protein